MIFFKKTIAFLMIPILLFGISFTKNFSCSASEKSSDELRPFTIGDVDKDSYTSILDATTIQCKLADFFVTDFDEIAADFDNDLSITIIDATVLQLYLVGEEKISIEEYSSENETVRQYSKNVDYTNTDADVSYLYQYLAATDYKKDRPGSIDIQIPTDGFFVLFHQNGVTTYPVSRGSFTVQNLIPDKTAKYVLYSQKGHMVKAGYLRPTGRIRMINGGGNTFNIRDIGGWACDGGTLKYGLIYRGCELNGENYHISITEEEKRMFTQQLRIADEIDLRKDEEVSGADKVEGTEDDITSSVFGAEVAYIRRAFSAYNKGINLNNTEQVEYCRLLLSRIIDDAVRNKPCYIHCMAGADRTGTLCFILEALCGVGDGDLDKEYELTGFCPDKRYRNNNNWISFKNNVDKLPGSSLRNKMIGFALSVGLSLEEINAFRSAMIDGEPELLTTENIK